MNTGRKVVIKSGQKNEKASFDQQAVETSQQGCSGRRRWGLRMRFTPIKTMSRVTRRVIVAYSGGKDSAVTLDICSRYFDHVYVFRMYLVPGLSFDKVLNNFVKNRYDLEILELPHFILSPMLRYGSFRQPDLTVPIIKVKDIYDYVRVHFDCWWIAGGERMKDSIWRNAFMKKTGSIDKERGRFYPVAYWSKADIQEYLKRKSIKISPESHVLTHSFRGLISEDLELVKKYYPIDYEKIRSWFPLVEVSRMQGQMMGNANNENRVSEV